MVVPCWSKGTHDKALGFKVAGFGSFEPVYDKQQCNPLISLNEASAIFQTNLPMWKLSESKFFGVFALELL